MTAPGRGDLISICMTPRLFCWKTIRMPFGQNNIVINLSASLTIMTAGTVGLRLARMRRLPLVAGPRWWRPSWPRSGGSAPGCSSPHTLTSSMVRTSIVVILKVYSSIRVDLLTTSESKQAIMRALCCSVPLRVSAGLVPGPGLLHPAPPPAPRILATQGEY